MAKIEASLPYALVNEGGFCIDDGGPTNFGITIPDVAAYRKVPLSQITTDDMRNLSLSEATAIYKQQYWDALSLDQVNDQNIATCIFDTGVNRGIGVGAQYAQKVCTLLGHSVVVDGQIGPLSLAAINQCARAPFIQHYEALEMAGYLAIAAGDPAKYDRYLAGWENRAKRLLSLL